MLELLALVKSNRSIYEYPRNKLFDGLVFRILLSKLFIVPFLYQSYIPTSIDDQANHIKRKSNLIFGEAATTGFLKRKDERDITRNSDLKNKRMTDKKSDISLKTFTVSQIFSQRNTSKYKNNFEIFQKFEGFMSVCQ